MNYKITQKLFFVLIVMFISDTMVFGQLRTVTELTENWKFQKGQNDQAYKVSFDDGFWQMVTVPHDWAIYGPFDESNDKYAQQIHENMEKDAATVTGRTGALPFIGEAWYRNSFKLPKSYHKEQKVILAFDGVMSEPKVYLNGQKVGEWNYGYNYFYFDITDLVKQGEENLLAVNCINYEQQSRWYPGAGIYRKVQLIVKNENSIDHWGVSITTPVVSAELSKVNIKTKVSESDLSLVTQIYNPKGQLVATDTTTNCIAQEFEQNIRVPNPLLWSPENPELYTAVTKLYNEQGLSDEVKTIFGIRSITYGSEGFRLNGELRKFKGVCLHHDLGPLGTAVNIAALRRQLTILKDMGVDAIRTTHNMPAMELLELCDEMGFMVMAEAFDEWKEPKMKNGYHRFFDTDAEKDIINMVHATRNHPCIVMWSTGNEVPDQKTTAGPKVARYLQDIFHREDPTRPVTAGMNQIEATMKNGFATLLDVAGLNYRTEKYTEAHEMLSQGFLLGAETASTISSRGIYKFPVEKRVYFRKIDTEKDADHQCSSYDLSHLIWSNLPEKDFALQDDNPWTIGQFVWTGFDYLGEPSPFQNTWPARSSYFGIVDLAGLPKDRYYLYRSQWNKMQSTLHILPHWTWPGREGETTPVFVYTSYDSAELFVNGKSQGVQHKNDSTLQNRYRLMWMDVKYEPGTLKVVAFDKDGKPAEERQVVTAGEPYRIVLKPDRTVLNADGEDLSFVTVSVVDKNGIPCPTASNRLNFKVTGAGTYRAACNGDATSLEVFHEPTMKLFSGKLVVVVKSTKEAGSIELNVQGKGLKGTTVNLESTITNNLKNEKK